ncbi:MAG: agmatinase [Ignavibacteria bacterium]|nr:agmatinase [Ignavibacteria bacterium]
MGNKIFDKKIMKTYNIKRNFLGIEEKFSNYKNSFIAILPVPFEQTTSYGKGTEKGPNAILDASHYVEFFDEETQKEICFDRGITTLVSLNFKNNNIKTALNKIYKSVLQILTDKKFVVTLGGEHTISISTIKAHLDYYSHNFSILHFDAHSDLRDSYEGTKYSHACFMARVLEFTNKITQVGIRAQCKEEYLLIKEKNINTFYAYNLKNGRYGKNWIDKIIDTLDEKVYITFDVDFLDPSIMPSTGTPEPGGFLWEETLQIMKALSKKRKVIGFDIVELAPKKNLKFPDFLTAKLIYKMLNYFNE